jgi:hypothetical protein
MADTLSSSSLVVAMEVVGLIILAAALIYGSFEWSRRRRARYAVSEATTRGLCGQADRQERREEALAPATHTPIRNGMEEEPPNPKRRGKLRSGREEGRWSEDEMARERLGVTGRSGTSKPKLLDERETQISEHLDPGHTA